MRTTSLLVIILGVGSLIASCGSSSSPSDAATGGSGGASGGTGGGTGGSTGTEIGTTSHCDIDNNGTQSCIEYAPDFTPSRAAGCTASHGTYATGACSPTNSSGGCRRSVSGTGTETTYFYMPITVDDVKVTCMAEANATYVAP